MSVTTAQKLAELECEMNALIGLRAERIATAETMIARANRDFDEVAIPLGRKINQLRAKLQSEKPEPQSQVVNREPDPEWSQADIDHFKELRGRVASNSTRSKRKQTT